MRRGPRERGGHAEVVAAVSLVNDGKVPLRETGAGVHDQKSCDDTQTWTTVPSSAEWVVEDVKATATMAVILPMRKMRLVDLLACETGEGYRGCDLFVHDAQGQDHPKMQKVDRLAEPMKCLGESAQLAATVIHETSEKHRRGGVLDGLLHDQSVRTCLGERLEVATMVNASTDA